MKKESLERSIRSAFRECKSCSIDGLHTNVSDVVCDSIKITSYEPEDLEEDSLEKCTGGLVAGTLHATKNCFIDGKVAGKEKSSYTIEHARFKVKNYDAESESFEVEIEDPVILGRI